MTTPTPSSSHETFRDPTFSKYTVDQARQYAIDRGSSYPAELYTTILNFHDSTGGQRERLMDVGCGHGKATEDLSPFFDSVIGTDHSVGMIDVARSAEYKSRGDQLVRFEVGSEFDLEGLVERESVDLLTAAMSAHWFDMEAFWKGVAKVLKPGGTVALWTCASQFCHPSTPNASLVQSILFDLEYNILRPHVLPGNLISQSMYDTLLLPWQIPSSSYLATSFPSELFVRRDWNRNGKLEPNQEDFLLEGKESLEEFERGLGTASMVTRWREAHPEMAGTERDCVKVTIKKIREALKAGGDEGEELRLGCGTALLMFKKVE